MGLPGIHRLVRRFRDYILEQRMLIIFSFLALLGEIILRSLEPWPLKFVFDRVFITKHTNRVPHLFIVDQLDPITLITLAALAVVTITALRALAAYWNTIGFALVGNRVLTKIRSDLYRHLQCLSLSFHNKARTGDLIVRVSGDIGQLQDVLITAALPLIGNFLILVVMLCLMLWMNWQLALLALATAPLFWLFTTRFSRRIHEVARTQRRREGAVATTAAESIGAIKVVQALSLEGAFAQAFSNHNLHSLKESVKGKRLSASLERTIDVLIAVATAVVLWFGAKLVMLNQITPGDLLIFLAYLKNGFRPLQDFAKYTGRLAKAAASGERVLDLFDQVPTVRDIPGAIRASAFKGAVIFKDVSFAYERNDFVLENVEFEVRPNQHVAIVGSSGCGKSTLISLILRLYDPVRGAVLIDGHDIRKYTLQSLRNQISVVLQDSVLFAASVRDNLAFGAPDVSFAEIEAASRLANAHQFIQSLPAGYETILGERGVTISSGERQRIAIARAAIRKAPILILDEPTTGLDKENERSIIEALHRLGQDRTTFIITHNLQLIQSVDMIYYIENGRIAERGTHGELVEAKGRYAALYNLHLSKHDDGVSKAEAYALTR